VLSRPSYSLSDTSSPLLPDRREPSAIPRPVVGSGCVRGVPADSWGFPTDKATALALLVDERELRVLVGGEAVDSSFVGPWMIWVIFALGRNMGVVGAVIGERILEGVEKANGCCGGDKRVCILVVEPTLAVRVRGNGEG